MLPPGSSEPAWLQLIRWIADPIRFLEDGARRYGDAFTVRLSGSPPLVVFSHPSAIKEVFGGDPEVLHAGKGHFVLEPLLGPASLLLLDGQRHLQERRLMLPAFHGERMRTYGEVMRAVVEKEIDGWPLDQPFAVHESTQRMTMDIILQAVFGVQHERLAVWRDRLHKLLAGTTHPLVVLGSYVLRGKLRKLLHFGADPIRLGPFTWDISRFMPWMPITRVGREIDEMVYEEVRQRKAAPGDDILSLLIEARDESGRELLPFELRDEMMTLLLAGHETTATTAAFTIQWVLRDPELLHIIRNELSAGAGEYLDATIKETLRLAPILPMLARQLQSDCTIGGYHLPAGVLVCPCPYLTHRRPDVWPDPLAFRPERFIGRRPAPHEYLPFGGGTRRCLGAAFASYELKILLAEVFSRVSMHLHQPQSDRIVRRGITLYPEHGVPVVVDGITPKAGDLDPRTGSRAS